MASQILTPFDVTGTASTCAGRRPGDGAAPAGRPGGARPGARRELAWLLVSVLTGAGAAGAVSAWMIASIHLW